MTDNKLARMLGAYQKIRAERSTIKRSYEETDGALKRKLSIIEVALLKIMNDTGIDQIKVANVGLAYKTDKAHVSATDWDAVWKYIEENGRLDFLQRRLSVNVIKDYMEENDGALPPGVDVSVERTVIVKKA